MKSNINIELFLLCFNEQKIVPHTLNYYSKFCNKITIFDNDSTDDSVGLIKKIDDKINIIRLDSKGEYREDLLMQTRNNCWKKSKADYVIVCDMDEFLYDEFLINKLISAKNKGIAIPVVNGYNMMSSEFPSNYEIPIMNQIKYGLRDRMFDKHIIFDPKKIKKINYGPGSHSCSPEFYNDKEIDELLVLKLLHYKYIEKKYVCEKHQNYAERMSAINNKQNWGVEYNAGDKFVEKVFDLTHYLLKVI